MLRGMSRGEFAKLADDGILVSSAMELGVSAPNTAWRRFLHTLNSKRPPSANVSTAKLPFVGRYFARRSNGVVAQFDVSKSSLQKSLNVFENEYLVLGGTRVSNVRLLDSTYRAGWQAYAGWGIESTGFFIGGVGAVGAGVYYGHSLLTGGDGVNE